LALLALRTEATVLPGYLTPMRDGRYWIKFLPPVELVRSGNLEADIPANTRIFNQVIETMIRDCPEAWLWGHKRWKNQPGGVDLYTLPPEELDRYLRGVSRDAAVGAGCADST
jgi:KDO2-lipid IV(A) lauroyltransferase